MCVVASPVNALAQVDLVDLPQPPAGPPTADGGDDVVDAAEVELHLSRQLLGAVEGRVVVHT